MTLKKTRMRGKDNATLKIPVGPKMLVFEKINSNIVTALEEHFTEVTFVPALKKKYILRSRRRRTTIFGAFSYGA
jgi:hypothetical protein